MGKFGRERRDNRSQIHQAVCAECGKRCEVPFKPTGDKPLYCDRCFKFHKDDRKQSNRGDFNRGNFKRKSMHQAVCAECGKKCEVPFRPTSNKPVYCDNCFGKQSSKENRSGGEVQSNNQLNQLSEKLDQILELLLAMTPKVKVKAVDKSKLAKKSSNSKPKDKKISKAKSTKKKITTKKKKK
jgi:CxxC-x17-CxxC domain-containing protein